MPIDHNVVSTERWINDQDDAAERACFACAVHNGHTTEEAENCDDGSVNCPDCPFGRTPKRIQRKRTKGWRMPEGSKYVGRSSRWGNDYVVGTPSCDDPSILLTAQMAVELFEEFQLPEMLDDGMNLDDLRGYDLVCWCPLDQPCHADVYLRRANEKR